RGRGPRQPHRRLPRAAARRDAGADADRQAGQGRQGAGSEAGEEGPGEEGREQAHHHPEVGGHEAGCGEVPRSGRSVGCPQTRPFLPRRISMTRSTP
ncbi:hypothetical protein MJ643_30625, partial [Pseudomonas sp. PNPG3]